MVEKGLDEIGPAVLVVEVIGVFPYVAGQERGLPFGQRSDRVWRADNLERTLVGDKPGPAAAELADRRRLELLLEFVEAAAIAGNRRGEIAARRAAPMRLHRIPEKGVVPHLGGVVEHPGFRRVLVASPDQVFERLARQRRVFD